LDLQLGASCGFKKMTSGVALETSRAGPQNRGEISENGYWDSNSHGTRKHQVPKIMGEEVKKRSLTKKRHHNPISTPLFSKKSRTCVQRTHSPPKSLPESLSSPAGNSYVEEITPSIQGIKEVALHLLKSQSNGKSHFLLALPTECTYEICSLVSWSKKESLSESGTSFREEQLKKRKSKKSCKSLIQSAVFWFYLHAFCSLVSCFEVKAASSSSSVHVYLQHHNIKEMDRILEFPKKAFATKQNPEVCSAFNESRVLFQRLADQFWPGPVHLYLPPQSFAPDGLMQRSFRDKRYIGFRCPSHPLTVKVLKQIHQEANEPVVLVGSPIHYKDSKVLKATDVSEKYSQTPTCSDAQLQILQGEERREIFSVPTCQFQEEWLECWIVPDKRTIVLKGKSSRDVLPQLKQMLRSTTAKNRVIQSVLQHWKVADQRKK
jgi:hypothetical protein